MQADDFILKLPHTTFKIKQSLPKHPGIYYVVDNNNQEILYIGQSVNINSRWLGRGHHREEQLTSLMRNRRTTLTIYHEYVQLEFLNITERKRIDQYDPLLNESPVKTRKTIPAEQLLMESLEILKDNVIILGIEDPRKQIATSLENASNRYRLSQASILEFPVIHLLLTPNNPSDFWLKKKYLLQSLLKHTKRSRYAKQWSRIYNGNHNFVCHRFISNGYIFELTEWWYWNNALQNELSYQDFNQRAITIETTLASFTIKALSKQSFGLLIPDSSKKNNPVRYLLERLSPYEKEVISIINLSNDLLPKKSLKKLINTNVEEEIKKVLEKINKLTTLFSELRSLIIGEYLDGATRCIVVTVHSNEDSIFQTSMKKGKGGWSIEPIYYEFEGKEYKSNITKYTVNNYRFEFIYFSQIIDYMCLEDRLINVKTSLILGKEVKALSSLCFVDNLLNDASNESIKTSDSYWFTRSSILQEGSYLFNLRYKLKTLESEPIETKPVQVNMTIIESNTSFTDIDSLLVSQGR